MLKPFTTTEPFRDSVFAEGTYSIYRELLTMLLRLLAELTLDIFSIEKWLFLLEVTLSPAVILAVILPLWLILMSLH